MSSPLISAVGTLGMCATSDVSRYDMATAHMACKVMQLADWLVVTPEHVAELLHFSLGSGNVSVATREGATQRVYG